jgi:hypothetical protein
MQSGAVRQPGDAIAQLRSEHGQIARPAWCCHQQHARERQRVQLGGQPVDRAGAEHDTRAGPFGCEGRERIHLR